MALHPPPLALTPAPWQLSSSRSLSVPQTHHLLLCHHSRFAILHAIGTRNNANFDPWKKFDGNNDNDDMVFLRKKSRRQSRRRQWWSGNNQVEGEQVGGIVDNIVDNLWILQVFRFYGVFLPIILISLLLATGPKAFLMGSGIPFGLSLLVFAFNKLSEWWLDSSHIPNPQPKRRRKRSRFTRSRDVPEYSKTRETEQGGEARRGSYQTSVSNFGGWDELVTEEETDRTRNPSVTDARLEVMMRKRKVGS